MTYKILDEVSLAKISNALKGLKDLKDKTVAKHVTSIEEAVDYSRDGEEDDSDFITTVLAEKLQDELIDEEEKQMCKKWMSTFEVLK